VEASKDSEITCEMIEAGALALCASENDDAFCSPREHARRIYLAMVRAKLAAVDSSSNQTAPV
jgi:hypothetical protein